MSILPWGKKKKQKSNEDDLDYSIGYVGSTDPNNTNKDSFTVFPALKKIYKKVKQVLSVSRNYKFEEPPTDLERVHEAFQVEGFLRRARNRFVELIWKNGFDITSSNHKAANYIDKRFSQIAKVTGVPTEQLFDKIAEHLVLYNNCFILKRRNEKASGGAYRRTFYGKRLKPVAGYFVVEPYRMVARVDRKKNRIKKWENFNENKEVIGRYNPEDVIHITMDKDQNKIFSQPSAVNILDDIRALRRMEENVELLIFQHTIPLYQYKVGTEEDGPGDGEIADVRSRLENGLVQGMVVTDGRHDITAVGARGEALDVQPYLNYFRNRIMIGVGQSASALGMADVSRASMGVVNKIVSDASSRYQRRIKSYVEDKMIDELLAEGGFDIFDPDTDVEFHIPEIDLDDKIRKEFHISSLWQSNLLSEDEAREELGRDPFSESEFNRTFLHRVTIPKIMASGTETSGDGSGEGERIGAPGNSDEDEQEEMPRNQYGTKRRSGEPKRGTDSDIDNLNNLVDDYSDIIYDSLDAAREDIIKSSDFDDPYTTNLDVSKDISIEKTSEFLIDVFKKGMEDQSRAYDFNNSDEYLSKVHKNNGKLINSLFDEVNNILQDSGLTDPSFVFTGINYKVKLLSAWMVYKTYYLSTGLALRRKGEDSFKIFKGNQAISDIDLNSGLNFDNIFPYNYNDVYKSYLSDNV